MGSIRSTGKRLPDAHPAEGPDPDVVLDVQAVLDRCYDNGGYADLIDHLPSAVRAPLPEEAAWVDGLLPRQRVAIRMQIP